MARKAKTRAGLADLRRERDEALARCSEAARVIDELEALADNLREALAEHAEDAARWRARAECWRETCDRLRFALDVVRERDELRAEDR